VCKEQELKNEEGDVKSLLEWERSVLTEVDAKYDPDDDSEDEKPKKRLSGELGSVLGEKKSMLDDEVPN
jgi:hypothetical protein